MSGDTAPSNSRRRFLALLTGGLAATWSLAATGLSGIFLSSTWKGADTKRDLLLGDLSIYGKRFRAVKLRIPIEDGWRTRIDQRMFYIRSNPDNPGRPIVFSATCSHLGCTVNWNKDATEFQCPCHGGRFAEDGSVKDGPPPAGLERIPAEIRGGDVYVTLA